MRQNLIVAGVVAAVLAVFVLGYVALRGGAGPSAMGGTATSGQRGVVPPVKGYLDRTEIRFIHTEASDAQIAQIAQIAQMLTSMMGSPSWSCPRSRRCRRPLSRTSTCSRTGSKARTGDRVGADLG